MAEFFARMGLDGSDFVNEIRAVRDHARAEFEKMAAEIESAQSKIERSVSGRKLPDAANAPGLEAGYTALGKLAVAGAHANSVLKTLGDEGVRAGAGLLSTEASTSRLSAALRTLGANDIETKFKGMGASFAVVTDAYDKGLISQRAYNEALQGYSRTANDVSDFIAGKVIPTEEKHRETYQQSSRQLRQLGEDISFVGARLTGLVSTPVAILGVSALKLAGDMEKAEVSMTRLTGSSELAMRTLSEMRQFAIQSPFEFKGALEGVRRLMSMGTAAEIAIPTLRTLGDATAAVGGDTATLNRFIKAIGDIQAKGYLAGEELRQLANIPVPAVALIARELGVSTGQVLEDTKNKAISASTAVEALMRGIQRRFGGEMAAQATTLNVLWKNVQEQGQFALRDIGKALTPFAKEMAAFASDMMANVTGMAQAFANLPQPVQNFVGAMGGILAIAGPTVFVFGQLISSIGHIGGGLKMVGGEKGFAGLLSKMAPLIPVVKVLAVGFAAFKFVEWANEVRDYIHDTGIAGKNVPKSFNDIKRANDELTDSIQFGAKAWELFTGALRAVSETTPVGMFDRLKREAGFLFRAENFKTDREWQNEFITTAGRPKLFGATPVADPASASGSATNLLKDRLDRRVKEDIERRERVAEEAEKQAAKERQRRASAFSTLGTRDFKTEIQEYRSAFAEFSNSFNDQGKQVIANNWIALLNEAMDQGAISGREYVNLLSKISVPEGKRTVLFNNDLAEAKGQADRAVEAFSDFTNTTRVAAETQYIFNLALREFNAESRQAVIAGMEFQQGIERMNNSVLTGRKGADKDLAGLYLPPGVANLKAALDVLNVKDRSADIQTMGRHLDTVGEAFSEGIISSRTYAQAWANYYKTRLENEDKLTNAEENHYEQIQRQLNAVTRLQQYWRGVRNQVSTIITDFSRSAIDIILPRESNRAPFSSDIMGGLERGFSGIANAGYSNPRAALQQTIEQIKSATTIIEANRIAIRAFGDVGPQIATGLRDGSISGDKLAQALDRVSSALDQTQNKGSKFKQLMDEVKRSILRAFAEEAAKAVADFAGKHLRRLISNLDEILTKIPVIGKGLERIFGGGKNGGFDISQVPSVSTGPGAGAPTIPGYPTGTTTTKTSSAGSAAGGGVMGAVNMATGIVSAVADVVTAIGTVRLEGTMNAVEWNTRKSSLHLEHMLTGPMNTYLPELQSIRQYMWEVFHPAFIELVSRPSGGGSGGDTFNIYINGETATGVETEARALLEAGARQLRRAGYRGARG